MKKKFPASDSLLINTILSMTQDSRGIYYMHLDSKIYCIIILSKIPIEIA